MGHVFRDRARICEFTQETLAFTMQNQRMMLGMQLLNQQKDLKDQREE